MSIEHSVLMISSGIARGVKKIAKNREKEGRKRKNREGSLTLPLLTDRAGYATDDMIIYTLYLSRCVTNKLRVEIHL